MIGVIKYICLPSLSLIGIFTVWMTGLIYVGLQEGLRLCQNPDFTGASYTGLPIIDIPLSTYLLVYRYISDSAVSPASLQIFAFFGGLGAVCMLIAIDNHKTNTWRKVQKKFMILSCLSIFTGAGVYLPLYFASSLPPAKPLGTEKIGSEKNLQRLFDLQAFTLIFFYLPFISLGLPSSVALSPAFKDHAVVMMSFSPIIIVTATGVSAWLRHITPRSRISVTWNLESAYTLTVVCASLFHVIAVVGSISIAKWRGSAVGTVLSAVGETFIPCLQREGPCIPTMREYSFTAMQWDYIMFAIATVLWSMALYIDACRLARVKLSPVKLCLSFLFQSFVIGPIAASIRLLIKKEKISEGGVSLRKEH